MMDDKEYILCALKLRLIDLRQGYITREQFVTAMQKLSNEFPDARKERVREAAE